jgi:AcrR family transcriptional regulator
VNCVTRFEHNPVPREERRRRTEGAILEAAKELFAETGYERTTIRAVAGRAGVDPALVMQHFGSKAGLFAASARWSSNAETVLGASPDQVPSAALHDLLERFEGEQDRVAASAVLRSCLTHPEASRIIRDDVMCERAEAITRAVGGDVGKDEAELRAGLVGATLMGLALARYLLELPAVAGATREDVERLMVPALAALLDPPDAQAAADPPPS